MNNKDANLYRVSLYGMHMITNVLADIHFEMRDMMSKDDLWALENCMKQLDEVYSNMINDLNNRLSQSNVVQFRTKGEI